MPDIIIRQPHPLDEMWENARTAVETAHAAVEAHSGDEGTLDDLVDVASDAIRAACALPVRGVADSAFKLVWAVVDGELQGTSAEEIVNELIEVCRLGLAAGKGFKAEAADAAA